MFAAGSGFGGGIHMHAVMVQVFLDDGGVDRVFPVEIFPVDEERHHCIRQLVGLRVLLQLDGDVVEDCFP